MSIGKLADLGVITFSAIIGLWLLGVTIMSKFYGYKATLHFNELNEWYADVIVFSIFTCVAIWRTFYWIRKYNEKEKKPQTTN